MRLRLALACLGLFTSLAFFSPVGSIGAATPPGITVSPAFVQLDIPADQPSRLVEFQITNNRPVGQTIKLSTADFNALEDTGGLIFAGTKPSQLTQKYGLASWLNLSQAEVTLAPGQTAKVQLTIDNRPDLTAGGHYGALLLNVSEPNQSGTNNAISLQPIGSALLFINKVGGDIHNLSLDNIHLNKNPFVLPSRVVLDFRNQGNTHLVPRGTVQIYDPSQRLISQGVINQDSNIILPELRRKITVNLSRVSLPEWPGKYSLNVNYRYDGYNDFKTYKTGLWLLAPAGLLIALLSVAGLLAVVYWQRKKT